MAYTKFSVEEDNRLIELIVQNPTIFDPQCELYKDVNTRENVWRRIAARLNKNDVDCRKRWKHMRDSYNRYKRKRKSRNKSAPHAKNSKWDFFQKMSFLEKISGQTDGESGIDTYSDSTFLQPSTSHEFISCDDEATEDKGEDNYEASESQSFSGDPITKPERTIKHREYYLDLLRNKEDTQYELLQELGQTKTDEIDDDVNTFGDHVKCVLKKLSPRLKILAKNEIFSILTKYETKNMGLQGDKQNPLDVKIEL